MIEIPKMNELSFEDSSHTYRLDGCVIPSVSEIMKPLSDFEYGDLDARVVDNAADRGTAVHNAIENWIKFGIQDIDTELEGYFDGFRSWWDKVQPEVIGSEIRVYHNLFRYAGTIDLVAKIGDTIFVIDFKTTSRLIEKNCGVQLEAYSQALESQGVKVGGKMILHLKKDGKYKEMYFPQNDSARWRVFGALKIVWNYIKL